MLRGGEFSVVPFLFLFLLTTLGSCPIAVAGFCPSSFQSKLCVDKLRCTRSSTALTMSNMFDAMRDFFDPFGGNNDNEDDDDDTDSDELPAGSQRIVTIPVESIKPGGLRLFLMFYLLGMQNTPDRGSWRADQPSTEEYVVDFFFHDHSAILSVNLRNEEIVIDRVGTSPSNAYMMHESVVVEGILSELDQCAFDESVEETNRLLILKEPKDAIEKARESLAFS